MPGDELHETRTAAPGARTGPRHAAPRKPLLTRLHVPAGKAIAIAAMPSAVLMGMGLTPQLAMAKPQPESPFRKGPCVSAPDTAEQQAKEKAEQEKAAKEKAEKEKAAKEKAEKDKAAEGRTGQDKTGQDTSEKGKAADKDSGAGTSGTPTGTPPSSGSSATAPDKGRTAPEPAPSPSAGTSTTPSPSATPSERNPWYDPLGVGKKLHDVFHPGEDEAGTPGASPSPSLPPSSSAPAGKGSGGTSGTSDGTTDGQATGPLGNTADKPDKAADDTTGKAGKALDDAKGKAGDALPSPSPSPSGSATPDAPDADGKKPFPCVEEKKAAGQDEQSPATVPNQPWYLESSGLTLRGLDYEGVVNLTMADGRTKQALKFTADSIDIGDLHQIVDGPAGKKYHVQAAKGSTSTIRGGKVTMYTERLQGNLFGLIPIVFDPEHPPPINVPFAYFTKVKITQAGQFGGNLTVPGLHQSITS
ncbi:hypothetical protein [Streptomyces sp. NPDC018045]|uniref:hypothetical protein n=1 Tax=Streptomyces sp. NPDC018045 TaxID=3365037 RepID=UPI0037A6B38B